MIGGKSRSAIAEIGKANGSENGLSSRYGKVGEKVKAFNQVAVVGAGTMGHGLALLFALGGSQVCLVDVSRDRLEPGHAADQVAPKGSGSATAVRYRRG